MNGKWWKFHGKYAQHREQRKQEIESRTMRSSRWRSILNQSERLNANPSPEAGPHGGVVTVITSNRSERV